MQKHIRSWSWLVCLLGMARLWNAAPFAGAQEDAAPAPEASKPAREGPAFPERPRVTAKPTEVQAAEAARWIGKLGHDEFEKRQAAAAELRKLGLSAGAQLREAAQSSREAEVRQAALALLKELETEVWEGYYFSSLDRFEDACAQGVRRVRFWFVVSRGDDGSFAGRADGTDETKGTAAVAGRMNRDTGEMAFEKQYDERTSQHWSYAGKWSPERQRVEGTYGPGSGGFVLFPRRLTEAEKEKFDAKKEDAKP